MLWTVLLGVEEGVDLGNSPRGSYSGSKWQEFSRVLKGGVGRGSSGESLEGGYGQCLGEFQVELLPLLRQSFGESILATPSRRV